MKFLIATLLCLTIGLYESVPLTKQVEHIGIRCLFQNNQLSCGDQVECGAVSNIAHLGQTLHNAFGIGALPESIDYTNLHAVVYDIYPKGIDSKVYLNNTIQLEGKSVELHLYTALENTGHGIRVIDQECFGKLVGLIRQVKGVNLVKVQSNLLGDGVDVGLIGEVLIENEIVKKRQFYGSYGGYQASSSYSSSYGGFGGFGGGYGGYASSYSSSSYSSYGGYGFGK